MQIGYQKRLENDVSGYRPVSGSRETQAFHAKMYPDLPYEGFVEPFNVASANVNFDEWMTFLKDHGCTYVILTTKHHDGFCLWPTQTTLFHSARNLVGDFVQAATAAGLKYGFYFSWTEFSFLPETYGRVGVTPTAKTKTCTQAHMRKVIAQVTELLEYAPDMWFFDGHWDVKTKAAIAMVKDFINVIRKNPQVEVNDRLTAEKLGEDELGMATYRNYADRYMPAQVPTVPWEHVMTIGYSWGRNNDQDPKDYHCGAELHAIYQQVVALGGRYLINFGPSASGELDLNEVDSFRQFHTIRNQAI